MTQEQLSYLKSYLEGHEKIELWQSWIRRNEGDLKKRLKRKQLWALQRRGSGRIEAIADILRTFGIPFTQSDQTGFGNERDGYCDECGGKIESHGHFIRTCPHGCFCLRGDPHRTRSPINPWMKDSTP